MGPFEYPTGSHERRHGPSGYRQYESYRAWLRNEFSFRCVYCLQREQWCNLEGVFHIDHFLPQLTHPDAVVDYDNLVYSCARCNEAKKALEIPNICEISLADCLRIRPDGTLEAVDNDSIGERLIKLLRLNSSSIVRYRQCILETVNFLEEHNRQLFVEWMRYPDDLPDLSTKKPPSGNNRPSGIGESFSAKRERGELDATY